MTDTADLRLKHQGALRPCTTTGPRFTLWVMDGESRPGTLASHPAVVWLVKHMVSPVDRWIVRTSKGRVPPLSSVAVPTLLLTTTGRKPRTVPLVFVRDGNDYVVANARPRGERRNPWVLNLADSGRAEIRVDGRTSDVLAAVLQREEIEEWWPRITAVWPAFDRHYTATGERTAFRLTPIDDVALRPARPAALAAVKATHTAIWFSIEAAMLYVIGAGFARCSDRSVAIAAGIVAAETAVFLGNGARCPLTRVAESLGADQGSVTDIYLPRWLARYLPAIHVPLIALAVCLHTRNLRARRS